MTALSLSLSLRHFYRKKNGCANEEVGKKKNSIIGGKEFVNFSQEQSLSSLIFLNLFILMIMVFFFSMYSTNTYAGEYRDFGNTLFFNFFNFCFSVQ